MVVIYSEECNNYRNFYCAKNMAFLAKFYLVLGLAILNVKSLPTGTDDKNLPPDTLYYDVLVKNCPILKDVTDTFKNQDIFKKCKSWQKISETKNLIEETNQNVLCLLYYDSFISLCNEINTKKISNVEITLEPDLKDYKGETVCKNLALFPTNKTFEHNVNKMISDERICYKLCVNYDDTPVRECSLAHYFANYDILSLTNPQIPNMQQPEADSKKVESKSADKASNPNQLDVSDTQNNLNTDINNSKTKLASNKETVEKQDSAKNQPLSEPEKPITNNIKPKTKTVSSSNTLENKSAKSPSDSVGNPQLPPNSNPAANENLTNKNTGQDQTQTDNKSQPKDEPKSKDETHSKDETYSKDGTKDEQKQSVPLDNISDQHPEIGQQESDGNKGETDFDAQNTVDQLGVIENESMGDAEEEDEKGEELNNVKGNEGEKNEKPITLTVAAEMPAHATEELDGESYFFSYFMVICVLIVLGYVGYHNKQKVMALMLEGKRGKRQVRGRRPNSANYHKLDSNLEEAISSTCTKNTSHVIY